MDDKNSTVKQRILLFIKAINISQKAFETKCGFSNGYVNNISKGIGAEKLQRILCEYPELNRDWLIFGEGEMLRDSVNQASFGNNSPNVNSDNNHVGGAATNDAALAEIAAQRQLVERSLALLEKKDAQMDRLINLLEKISPNA